MSDVVPAAPVVAAARWQVEQVLAVGAALREAQAGMSGAELRELTPRIDWPAYLRVAGAPETAFAEVVVGQPEAIAGLASLKMRLHWAILLAIAVTIFSTLVFSYALGLPFRRFGPWLSF